MKTAIAVLYTPLHVASLIRTLPYLTDIDSIRVLHIEGRVSRRKYLHYLGVLRVNPIGRRKVIEPGWAGSWLLWAQILIVGLLGGRCADILLTGNPRRSPSLLAARCTDTVVIIDEGNGTTVLGGYFDPSVREKSRIKRAIQACGLLSQYRDIFNKVSEHFTFFNESIFPRPVRVPFTPASNFAIDQERLVQQVLVVSSVISLSGTERFAKILNQAVKESRGAYPVIFCPHPSDPPKKIRSVMAAAPGARLLNTPLLLEEYCAKVIEGGGRITLRGDGNSTSTLLDQLFEGRPEYGNETD